MKKLLAITILSISANFTHASLASQHGEQFATLIGLNGLLCAKVDRITPLKRSNTYEVNCLEFRGVKGNIQYIVNMATGIAFRLETTSKK